MTFNYIVVAYLLMAIITFAQYWLKTRSNDYWTLAMIAILWPITLVYARILRNRWARYFDYDSHSHVLVSRVVYYGEDDSLEFLNKVVDAYMMHKGARRNG